MTGAELNSIENAHVDPSRSSIGCLIDEASFRSAHQFAGTTVQRLRSNVLAFDTFEFKDEVRAERHAGCLKARVDSTSGNSHCGFD